MMIIKTPQNVHKICFLSSLGKLYISHNMSHRCYLFKCQTANNQILAVSGSYLRSRSIASPLPE